MGFSLARVVLLGVVGASTGVVALACSSFTSDPAAVPPESGADGGGLDARPATPDAVSPLDAAVLNALEAGHDAQFGLACGASVTCNTAGQRCCYDPSQPAATAYHCANAADACDPKDPTIIGFPCDDTDDCTVLGKPGNVCCGTLSGSAINASYTLGTAACVLAANCAAHDEVWRCDRSVADQCPAGKLCLDLDVYPEPDDAGTWPVLPPFPACQRSRVNR